MCGACVGKPACYRPTMIEATEREREREVIHSFRGSEREDVGSSHEPRPMAPCQLEMVAQGHALRVSRVPSISSKERKSPLAVGVCNATCPFWQATCVWALSAPVVPTTVRTFSGAPLPGWCAAPSLSGRVRRR